MLRDTPTTFNRSSELDPDEHAKFPSRDTSAMNDSVGAIMLAQAAGLLGAALSLGLMYSDTGEPAERFRQVPVNSEPIRVLSVIDHGDEIVFEYIDEHSETPIVRSVPKERCVLMPVPPGTELDMLEFERYRTTRADILTPSKTEKLPDNLIYLKYPGDY